MITILGSSGFIGSHLLRRCEEAGIQCLAPDRDITPQGSLGDVIYCIGVTSDFRVRPLDTVEAHVCKLLEVLRSYAFDSLLYLSSTRLYGDNGGEAQEDGPLATTPLEPEQLYNISKLMGESAAFASKRNVRVARLSNVYGEDFHSQNFLSTIITQALTQPDLIVHSDPDAEKDYVSIDDVADGLIRIAVGGKQKTYNLASGINVSSRTLAKQISKLTGCRFVFDAATAATTFPVINIDRMQSEFGFQPRNILRDLDKLIGLYRKHYERKQSGS